MPTAPIVRRPLGPVAPPLPRADDGMIYGIAAADVISPAVPFRNDRLSKVLILCISSQARICNSNQPSSLLRESLTYEFCKIAG
jgi:hypothetical protein